jgi:hypothetical protein
VVNPRLLVLLAALVSALSMSVALLASKRRTAALLSLVVSAALLVFNDAVDTALKTLTEPLNNATLTGFVTFFSQSDVFLYMAVALASVSVMYLVTPPEKRSRVPLLIALIVFPIAFIGLSKVKYVLHFSTALAFAITFMFGELVRSMSSLSDWSGVLEERKAHTVVLACVLLVGLFLVYAQATGVEGRGAFATSDGLKNVRISTDWTGAYDWLRANTPQDARVLSWWDYGHWTTFLGERATVIDPNNAHTDFNQNVARAFVNGRDSDLYDVLAYHNANYVLVDAELVQKWGALVFLSGTCSGDFNFKNFGSRSANVCPDAADVDFTKGPGSSPYEVEHAFEFITDTGQNCPAALAPVPLRAYQSNLGVVYCASPTQYFVLTQKGLADGFARNFKVFGRDQVTDIRTDTSYWYPSPFGPNQWVNLNPDLSFANLQNKVLYSAFTRLYFLENMPGFNLAYRSPNGEVKIFEYTGRPPAGTPGGSPVGNPSVPAVTPGVTTNTGNVTATPTPAPFSNASSGAAANASASNATNSS